jgi:hypothetical protein
MGNEQTTQVVRSSPSGEFLGTIVNGTYLMDKASRRKLELQNIQRCKEQASAISKRNRGRVGEGADVASEYVIQDTP